MKEITERIGQRARKLRWELGWTQEKLAEEVDVSTSYIGMVERGEKTPSVPILERIALALGSSVGFLADRNREEEEESAVSLRKRKLIEKIYDFESKEVEMLTGIAEAFAKYKAT